ncbi:hypothetical protein QBK98_26465 (plasmid) [Klebsiella pneumoniae subsp. pneumoniae]|uniref:hypothetical protein n=1 Tax=Klebsiella pneumoniae TaxID=573 RepID=UPI0025B0B00D|nr:hypothetical protein [Klebsiella pneumoniae]MDQ6192387.1 hypothetical protein [Klebsiella pneumoniae]WJT22038.1 hypothetical protein QBK98_26465 [Klebsiella pneumoniae subsp. pneumoniae]
MGIGSWFGLNKNEFVIGGVKTKLPETDDQTMDLAAQLARQLGSKLPTEQDVYWFVIEFYDRASAFNHSARGVLGNLPFRLFEMEYEGRRSENSYVGRKNLASHTFLKM